MATGIWLGADECLAAASFEASVRWLQKQQADRKYGQTQLGYDGGWSGQ